jgi:hypothetical protein
MPVVLLLDNNKKGESGVVLFLYFHMYFLICFALFVPFVLVMPSERKGNRKKKKSGKKKRSLAQCGEG